MNWRDEPITEKQKAFIKFIEEDAGINGAVIAPFTGKTKGDASNWIKENNGKQFLCAVCEHEDAGDRIG